MRIRRLHHLLLAPVLLLSAAATEAAGLQVSPTMVHVPAPRAAEGLTLANSGASPLHAQVRVFRWTQQDGEDVLAPTQDIAVSPPMIELAGGSTQLVRVVRLGPPPQDGTEAAYRVLVDELPETASGDRAGLQFVLQYSIPVFLSPAGEAPTVPQLQADLAHAAGTAVLALSNGGNGHAQIADLVYEYGDGTRQSVATGLAGYVLPGSRRQWPLGADVDLSRPGAFKARINGETEERTLAVHSPSR